MTALEGEADMGLSLRLLIVDDHLVVRKGVVALLTGTEGIAVVGEAADGEQAITQARLLRPGVILMDLGLPGLDGIAATRAILAEHPETAIVALTEPDREDQVLAAIDAGAVGYVPKTSTREDFLTAIRQVAQGGTWWPAHFTRSLLDRRRQSPAPEPLTEREREVLQRIAQGWSNRQIAQDLAIAEITVRTHVSHIFGKLGVSNRVEAVLHVLRSEKLSPPRL
jgi:DNA-binding NarL/FixJ family response regulator